MASKLTSEAHFLYPVWLKPVDLKIDDTLRSRTEGVSLVLECMRWMGISGIT